MKPKTAILVKEQGLLRRLLAQWLRQENLLTPAEECASVRAGLAACQRLSPEIVIAGWRLQDGQGIDLVRQTVPKWPHIRVLLIASEARPADVKEALEAGAHGMLVRCDSLQVLRDAISVISSGQPYFCQNSTRLLVEAVRQAKFAKFDALTAREREILVRIARSETPKEIALRLGTCSKTVSNQLCALREKLGIRDVPGLVRYAIREGLVRATD